MTCLGFNSYTQSLCIDHAVIRDETYVAHAGDDSLPADPAAEIAQCVTFKTELIEKTSDLMSALNVIHPQRAR